MEENLEARQRKSLYKRNNKLFDNGYPLQLWQKCLIFLTQKVLLQIVALVTLLNTLIIFSELQRKYPKVPASVREILRGSGWNLLQ